MGHRNGGNHGMEHGAEEPGIFEPPQQCQTQNHGGNSAQLSNVRGMGWPGKQSADVVDADGKEHEQQKFGPAAGIKCQTEPQKNQISETAAPTGHNEIASQ